MARMLASVQKIIDIVPIEGADKIELAKVLGWQVVVKKGQFKVGDLCCYIEIDSIVPPKPCFEFLKERKYRIKTIRLKKVISQGLIMPFDELGLHGKFKEGQDLTDKLGIIKWEPPEDTGMIYRGKKKKSFWWKLVYTLPFLKMFRKKVGVGAKFPSHLVPKTDETRLQAFDAGFLERYKDIKISISTKMDGSSTTFILNKGKFSVASRNVWMIEKNDSNFWKIAEQTNIADAMKKVFAGRNICLQGEMCGPGIQDNKYKFTGLRFFLFGAFDSDNQEYFTPQELIDAFIELRNAGSCIEIVEQRVHPNDGVSIKDIGLTVDEWVQYAETKSEYNPQTWNEGIVVRSVDNKPYGVKGMEAGRFSFKVISPKFLLQYDL